MRNYFALLGFLLALFSGCANVPHESTTNNRGDRILKTKTNSRYGVTCLFRGEEVSVGDRNTKVIRYLTLRTDPTGEEVKYDTPMKYHIVKQVLTILDPKLKSIEAVNSKGDIAILSN